ncbi:MAG: hypothetical protein LAO31_13990 [Acidobacteriia bacterium]|nr:hypothetical protein [Terriglobia bacterium]
MKTRSTAWMTLSLLLFANSHLWPVHPEGRNEYKAFRQTIRMYDQVNIDPRTLKSAEKIVDNIFKAVRVELLWIVCSRNSPDFNGVCGQPLTPPEIGLRIVQGPSWSLNPSGHFKCGLANRIIPGESGGWISISSECIEQIAKRLIGDSPLELGRAQGIILGHFMTHEIGHLLLPIDGHSITGIMQERLGRREWALAVSGLLGFTREEADMIRQGVQVRSVVEKESFTRSSVSQELQSRMGLKD